MTATTTKQTLVRKDGDAEGPVPGGYQSKEALEASKQKMTEVTEEKEKPKSALVAGELSEDNTGLNRMVRVRSREYIPPFRYGPATYSLQKGKDCLIPLCVKQHLEEKNLL
jgi:hypothetical protein